MTREQDALIAEKIMRYTLAFSEKAWTDEDWVSSDSPTERNVMAIAATPEQFPGTGAFSVSIPHYSDDLTLAWQAADVFADRYGCAIEAGRAFPYSAVRHPGKYFATVRGGRIAYARADCATTINSDEGLADALCQVMLQAIKGVLSEEEMRDL